MIDKYEAKEPPGGINRFYYRGQKVLYQGEDAQVLEVIPVFTIRKKGKSRVICGNIFSDTKPSELKNGVLKLR